MDVTGGLADEPGAATAGGGGSGVDLVEREAAVVVGEDLEDVLRHGVAAAERLHDVLDRGEQLLLAVLGHRWRTVGTQVRGKTAFPRGSAAGSDLDEVSTSPHAASGGSGGGGGGGCGLRRGWG